MTTRSRGTRWSLTLAGVAAIIGLAGCHNPLSLSNNFVPPVTYNPPPCAHVAGHPRVC